MNRSLLVLAVAVAASGTLILSGCQTPKSEVRASETRAAGMDLARGLSALPPQIDLIRTSLINVVNRPNPSAEDYKTFTMAMDKLREDARSLRSLASDAQRSGQDALVRFFRESLEAPDAAQAMTNAEREARMQEFFSSFDRASRSFATYLQSLVDARTVLDAGLTPANIDTVNRNLGRIQRDGLDAKQHVDALVAFLARYGIKP